ncbi:MAG: polysaccharide biosynthesis protein [Eubacteriales bacterium]|nr:polysaccharide biosynthesis protein [Eubacteriales bacterium]
MGKKNDNTLVKNASFLMVAALVSKIIGMLYKSPLSATLGNESMALFNYAQNVYFILLMIASFSIPQAVSKIMAEKLAFRRYRDAQKVFRCALLYVVIAGGAVALFCFFGSGILVPQSMAGARLALKMLSPTIFLSGILGVFRGYFQAHRNMMPTSVSQILEQIFVAVVALLMSGMMMGRFQGEDPSVTHAWGAAGATLGTGAGVLSALIFMLLVYRLNQKTIKKRIRQDVVSEDETTREVMRTILLIVMPIILSAFIYNVNGFINSYMYSGILGHKGEAASLITSRYAEYGYYMTLINIPLTLASTAPTSMIPEVSAQYAMGNMAGARDKIDRATWISMFISIPCAVGLAVLSGPITRLLFPPTAGVAGELLILGAITIILNGNSNISNGVLQGIGKPNIPMRNAAIALGADVAAMALLLFFTDLGVYAIVLAMIVYAVVMCLLNERAMKKYMRYQNPWRMAYLNPLLASVPMAATAGGVYYGLYALLHSNVICLGISVILAAFVYFLVYLVVTKPSDEDFAMMPGGSYLKRIAGKLGAVRP